MTLLRRIPASQAGRARRIATDAATLLHAQQIIDAVRAGDASTLRSLAEQHDALPCSSALAITRERMDLALTQMHARDRCVLERAADRVRAFAQAQRACLLPLDMAVSCGRAGHTLEPVDSVGCYAPGGRHPLPSSVLMTVIPARIAGARRVAVASPRPTEATLAAAALAGADVLYPIGGAHAIAAMAYGCGPVEPVDFLCGPGNRWVTAAKKLVFGDVGIDMIAGPSELLIVADDSADPRLCAADLLAQAEHDTDALPMIVSTSAALLDAVDRELRDALASLPTARTALDALKNGFAALGDTLDACLAAADRIAAEHLELHVHDPAGAAQRIRHSGTIFLGTGAAEVLGDYAIGPNHTLPTAGAARFSAGLSVLTFLRARSWISVDTTGPALMSLLDDTARFARLEGLEAHARAAEVRGVLLAPHDI